MAEYQKPVPFDPEVIQGPWSDADPEEDLEAPGQQSLAPDLARIVARRAFKQAFAAPKLTLDDLLTQRVVVVWRIVRRLGQLLGHPAAFGSIAFFFRAQHPHKVLEPKPLTYEAEWELPPAVREVHANWSREPMSLLPRPDWTKNQQERYRNALRTVGELLGIPEGAPDSPMLGRYGMGWLHCPDIFEEGMPTPYHLASWERRLTESVMERMGNQSTWNIIKWMRGKFGLTDEEAAGIMSQARELAVALTCASEDERRALLVMRLDELYASAKNTDARVALAAVKTAAQVQGLTKSSGNDDPFDKDLDALTEVIEDSQDEAIRALGLELPD